MGPPSELQEIPVAIREQSGVLQWILVLLVYFLLNYSPSICHVPVAAPDTKDITGNTLNLASILMRLSQHYGPEGDSQ